MGKIDRYVLSQLVAVFGMFSLILVSVYWVNRAVSIFDRLIAGGQSAWVFLEVVALALPNVVRLVLPIAAFASAVHVANRLSSESERVALEAAGFGAFRLAWPYLVFGVMVALLVGALAHVLVPASRVRLFERKAEISRDVAARMIIEGRFMHPAKGITFYIGEVSPTGELHNFFLNETRDDGETRTYSARSALLVRTDDAPKLVMFDGRFQKVTAEGRRLSTVTFDNLTYDMAGFIDDNVVSRTSVRELNTLTLLHPSTEILHATARSAGQLLMEAHRRIAETLAPIIYTVLGMAVLMLGRFTRFGLWRQIIGAVAALLIVWAIGSRAEDLLRDNLHLWPLLYLQALAGLALILGTLTLANHPSAARRRDDASVEVIP